VTAEPNPDLLGEYAEKLKMAQRALTAGSGSEDESRRSDARSDGGAGSAPDREESPPPWAARARIPDSRDLQRPEGGAPYGMPPPPPPSGAHQPPPPPPPRGDYGGAAQPLPPPLSTSEGGAPVAASSGVSGAEDPYAAYMQQVQGGQPAQDGAQAGQGSYQPNAYGYGYGTQPTLYSGPSRGTRNGQQRMTGAEVRFVLTGGITLWRWQTGTDSYTGYAPQTRSEMSVPGHIVGMIIGRGGENVKRLQMETGTRIQFPIGRRPRQRRRVAETPANRGPSCAARRGSAVAQNTRASLSGR